MYPRDYETFDHKGHTFRVAIEHDPDIGAPWKEQDGHGVVSDWTSRAKRPGELILARDRTRYRYYDLSASTARAKRDGWGPHQPRPDETRGQAIARAVQEDFEYLRAWCADDWQYVSVYVCWDDDPDMAECLGAVETFRDYHKIVARELADELMARIEVDPPHVVLSEN